jgi:hypothetical protein
MKTSRSFLSLWGLVTLSLTAFPVMAQDQASDDKQEKQGQQSEAPKPAGATAPWTPDGPARDENGVPTEPTPGTPVNAEIRQLGTGLPFFAPAKSPLRWGDFSVSVFEYEHVNDDFTPRGTNQTESLDLNILRGTLMFDHYFGKYHHLVLQYTPQLTILNGTARASGASNNAFGIGNVFHITPRFSLKLENAFIQLDSRRVFPDEYLAKDGLTGAVVQNNFLQNPGSFIEDEANATAEYKMSARTTITVSPMYRYARATNDEVHYLANGNTYGVTGAVTYALSQRSNLGVTGTYNYFQINTPAKVTQRMNTVGLFYGQQLARTWWITAQAGTDTISYSDIPAANFRGFAAGMTMLKDFYQTAIFTVAYNRGFVTDNYIDAHVGNRLDSSLSLKLKWNLMLINGVGYYRENGRSPNILAKYANSALELHFPSGLTFFAHYLFRYQSTDTPQLLSGKGNTYLFGLRWQPTARFGK